MDKAIAKDHRDVSYQVASEMAGRKERALETAIDFYFGDVNWDEEILAKQGGITVHPDGTEVFFINKVDLLKFSPIETNIDIKGNQVYVTYQQAIERLYSVA